MNFLAQVLGLAASVCSITSSQRKRKRDILFFLFLGECLFALSFLCLEAYTGFIVTVISAINTAISYYYNLKGKRLPKRIIGGIIIISIISGFIAYKGIYDILPIMAAVLYALLITRRREKNIRRMSLSFAVLWIIYDLHVGAYTGVISDLAYLLSSVTAILRFDHKKLFNKIFKQKK